MDRHYNMDGRSILIVNGPGGLSEPLQEELDKIALPPPRITGVTNLSDALRQIETDRPDLVVLDTAKIPESLVLARKVKEADIRLLLLIVEGTDLDLIALGDKAIPRSLDKDLFMSSIRTLLNCECACKV